MIAQFCRLLGMRLERLLDVVIREFLKPIVVGSRVDCAGERKPEGDDKCENVLHAVNGRERRDNDKQIPKAANVHFGERSSPDAACDRSDS